jgi:hypothetical protein
MSLRASSRTRLAMVFMNLVRKIGNIGDGLKTNMTTTYSDQLAEQRSALLRKAVRQAGLVGLCKSVAKGDVSVSEHELTKLIDEDAQLHLGPCARSESVKPLRGHFRGSKGRRDAIAGHAVTRLAGDRRQNIGEQMPGGSEKQRGSASADPFNALG